MKKEREIRPIKKVIEEVLGGWEKKKLLKSQVIKEVWQKVVGKKAAKHTKVSSFRAGRLIVEVDGSGWIYQLALKKSYILKRLNKHLKDIKIDELQFRISDFPSP